MSIPPYAQLRAAINGGAPSTGGLTVALAATVQLSADPAGLAGATSVRFEIYSYPSGFATPAGWSVSPTGVKYYTGTTPPSFTASPWGKYLTRLVLNNGFSEVASIPSTQLTDEATAISVSSPSGLKDLGTGEETQFSGSGWAQDQQANLRTLEAGFGGGGGGGGTVDAIKDPVHTIALTNITLSGVGQTINGRVIQSGDRVAPLGQTSGVNDGIYVAGAGAWTRASDMPAAATLKAGLTFVVSGGDYAGSTIQLDGTTDKVVGTDSLSWIVKKFVGTSTADARKVVYVDPASGEPAVSSVRIANSTPAVGQTLRARDLGGGVVGYTPEDGGGAIVQDVNEVNLPARDRLQTRGFFASDDSGNGRTKLDIGRADLRERGGTNVLTTSTATGTTGSATITIAGGALASAIRNGTWLLWHQSGPAHGMSTPGAPTVVQQGTTGATTWEFRVVALTSSWGYTAQGTVATITDANATLSASNFLEVWCAPVVGAFKYLVYARRGGSGSYTFAGAVIANPIVDHLGIAHVATLRITSNTFAKTPPAGIPLTAPSAAAPNGAWYKVVSGGGTTSLTLDRAPRSNATSTVIEACNAVPLEDSIRSFAGVNTADSGGCEVFLGPGYFWRITRDLYVAHNVMITGANRGRGGGTSLIRCKDGTGVSIANRRQAAPWQPGTMYRLGDRIDPEDGSTRIQIVSAIAGGAAWGASSAASSKPTFNTSAGATTTDNDVTWTCANGSTTPQATTALEASMLGVGIYCDGKTIPAQRICTYDTLRSAPVGLASSFSGKLWAPGVVTAGNRYVFPTNANATGKAYYTALSGTTGGTEPTWPKKVGDTVNDNGITWTCVDMPIHQGIGLRICNAVNLEYVGVFGFAGSGVLFDGSGQIGGNCNGSVTVGLKIDDCTGNGIVLHGQDANAILMVHPQGGTNIGGSMFVQDGSAYGTHWLNPQNDSNTTGWQNNPGNLVHSQSIIDNPYQEEPGGGFDWNLPGTIRGGINVTLAAGANALLQEYGSGSNTIGDHAHATTDGTLEWRLRSNRFYLDAFAGTLAAYTNSSLGWSWNSTTRRWQLKAYGNNELALIEFTHYTARNQRLAATLGILLGQGGIASPSAELLFGAVRALPTSGAYALGDTQLWAADNAALALRASKRGAEGIVARADSTVYAPGACVSQGGRIFVATGDANGTSAGSAAAFTGTETFGDRVVDGTVHWQCWGTTVQASDWRAIANVGDAPVALDSSATIQVTDGTVRECTQTANRTPTIGVTGAIAGMRMLFRSKTLNAFTLALTNGGPGGGTLFTLPASALAWAEIEFDGTNWQLYKWQGI